MDLKQLQKDTLKNQANSIEKWRNAQAPKFFRVGAIKIIVNPNVFSPKPDSVLLARKMIIKPGEIVLDTCAGTGIQTIFAVKKGAGRVYSCDINPDAVANIKLNVKNHKLEKIINVYNANLFPKIKVKADVIIANPPYTDHEPKNIIEKSVWDKNHTTLKRLLKDAPKYLKPSGRMYVSWANFAEFDLFERLIKENNYKFKKIASTKDPSDLRVEYRIYELSR
jgi:release factor glutamine methyltransferase